LKLPPEGGSLLTRINLKRKTKIRIEVNKMSYKYVSVKQEEEYFDETLGKSVDIENAMFLTPNYFSKDGFADNYSPDLNMFAIMKDTFGIEEEVIKNYARQDLASGGRLPMPCSGESVNVRMLRPPKIVGKSAFVGRCTIFGREVDLQYDIQFSSNIVKGILAEFEKNNISIDPGMTCIVNRVFTIAGKLWYTAPKELWRVDEITKRPVAPFVYVVTLRTDLEAMENKIFRDPEDLMTM
jgi:hypothetical protein